MQNKYFAKFFTAHSQHLLTPLVESRRGALEILIFFSMTCLRPITFIIIKVDIYYFETCTHLDKKTPQNYDCFINIKSSNLERHVDQWNRMKWQEINPCIYRQLVFDNSVKKTQWGKDSFFIGVGKTRYNSQRMKQDTSLIPYTKTHQNAFKI